MRQAQRVGRTWRLALAALLALAASGCLQVEEELEVGRDNRGRFALRMSVPLPVYRTFVEEPGKVHWPELARFFDIGAGPGCFPAAEGFDVYRYRVFEKDGRKHLQIDGNLTDLNKALASGKLGPFKPGTTGAGAQRLDLLLPPPPGGDAAAQQRRVEELRRLAGGLQLALRLTVPNRIVDTNAPKRDKRSATWTFDVDKDASFLAQPPAIFVVYE